MKTVSICYSFIKKNLVPIIITMLMMTVAMFILSTFIGEYNYTSYTKNVISNDKLANGVYCMPFYEDEVDFQDNTELKSEIMQYTACSHILSYDNFAVDLNDSVVNVMIYNKEMRESFKLHTDEGRWLSDDPAFTEAVIGGVTWGNTKVGDTITLDNNITATVVGIIGDSVVYPSFNTSGNIVQDSSILFKVNDTMVFLTGETIPQEKLEKYSLSNGRNLYVIFNDDATADEKEQLMSFLESKGVVATYEKIIDDSKEVIDSWVATALPLPLFLLIIATVNIISISAVIVKRTMPEYSRYYLIGCTKRKGIMLIAMPLSVIFSIPCIANIISITCCPNLFRAGNRTGAITYLFEANAVIPLVLYLALIIVILTVIPTIFYKKYSPLLFYRSNL